jgi:hypothetical protein
MPSRSSRSSRRESLQSQGVPFPERLSGPQNRFAERPQGSQRKSSATASASPGIAPARSGGGKPGPGPLSSPGASGIGLLAAEFFICIALLILLFFAKGSEGLPTRIMDTIKRGTLICAAFIILSLVAGIGPNANKIAKAFGALLVVAILLTAPIYGTDASGNPSGVLVDVDNIIKNDWAPSATHDNATSSSTPNANTPSSPGKSLAQLAQDFVNALKQAASLQGQKTSPNNNPVSGTSIKTDVGNAAVQLLNGVVPGSGTAIGKLFGF